MRTNRYSSYGLSYNVNVMNSRAAQEEVRLKLVQKMRNHPQIVESLMSCTNNDLM